MNKGYSNFNTYKTDLIQKANVLTDLKTFKQVIEEKKARSNKNESEKHVKNHPFSDPKHSPIKVPKNAIVKKQSKNSYEQIKDIWSTTKYRYESRWHTKTPNASDNKQSWVVTRTAKGKGYGKNVISKRIEVLVGKRWVSWSKWQEAISAKKNGTASKKQLNMLNKGHFTAKRGKK